MTNRPRIGLLERLRRWLVVPGCGPICIPLGAPSGVTVAGVPSCIGHCRACADTAASPRDPWFWCWDGQLHPEMPPVGWGYVGGKTAAARDG